MKISYSIVVWLFSIHCCFANIWHGDYVIKSQADADAFRRVCNCTSINGNLIIKGNDVKHVDSLYALIDINGSLNISNTVKFNGFYGLRRIRKIKTDLRLKDNLFDKIDSFDWLERIE